MKDEPRRFQIPKGTIKPGDVLRVEGEGIVDVVLLVECDGYLTLVLTTNEPPRLDGLLPWEEAVARRGRFVSGRPDVRPSPIPGEPRPPIPFRARHRGRARIMSKVTGRPEEVIPMK